MASTSQARALESYRKRLTKRGMARFEVLGLAADRDLVRSIARRLAENNPDAEEIRSAISQKVTTDTRRKGSILAMLRSAPTAARELNLIRERVVARKVDL